MTETKLEPGSKVAAAERLRRYLELSGVKRAQLYEQTETSLALRAHDLRASFVTISLALGKTEAWITDRTGHRSSQMIYSYKRSARTPAELSLGRLHAHVGCHPGAARSVTENVETVGLSAVPFVRNLVAPTAN